VLDEAERRETRERLRRALAALEPDDRRLLDLREAGRAWEDVAREVGLPTAEAARSRHRRVLSRLQRGESGPDAD
jgi:DNA-directed RNA polymerase specialized sigma24 family protein